MKALIVEPDSTLRKGMALALFDTFSSVTTASTPSEALQVVQETRFDIILTEKDFVTNDGMVYLDELRRRTQYSKILLITVIDSDETQRVYPVDGIVSKPIEIQPLRNIIQSLIQGGTP